MDLLEIFVNLPPAVSCLIAMAVLIILYFIFIIIDNYGDIVMDSGAVSPGDGPGAEG